jgi:hypothetical protein
MPFSPLTILVPMQISQIEWTPSRAVSGNV